MRREDDVDDVRCQLLVAGSATLYEANGQAGAMTAAIKPLDPHLTMAGRALTIDARPGDNLVIHHALTLARPGDVLVVDAKGFAEVGAWGDILTLAAMTAGVAGLVIDGAVRDSAAIIEMDFPVFSRGVCIKAALKNQPGRVNQPILCGGTRVKAGDWIVGDRDGVVVIGSSDVPQVLDRAAERSRAEQALRVNIRSGRSTVDLLGLSADLERLGLAR